MNTLKTTLATAAFILSSSAMADTINTDLLDFTTAAQKVMNKDTATVEKAASQQNLDVDTMACHFDSIVAVHEALRTEGANEVDITRVASVHRDCLKARVFDSI